MAAGRERARIDIPLHGRLDDPRDRFREGLASALAMLAFVATMALFVYGALWLAEYRQLRGEALDQWMIGAMLLSVLPAGAVLVLCMLRVRAMRRVAMQRQHMQREGLAAAQRDALRKQVRDLPDLARYADFLGIAPWTSTLEGVWRLHEHVRRLEALPGSEPYVQRLLRGEYFVVATVRHALQPELPLLCTHLQPLEQDLRAAGVAFAFVAEELPRVPLALDMPLLRARYGWPDTVTWWEEQLHGDRRDDYFTNQQRICCTLCASTLVGSGDGEPFTPR